MELTMTVKLGKEQVNQSSHRFANKFGIRAKVIALATIFGVLPVLAVGSVAYTFADDSITQQIASEKIAEAEQLSDKLSLFLQDRLANIKTIARVSSMVNRNAESIEAKNNLKQSQAVTKQKLADELTAFVQDYLVYSNISLYNLQGQVIVQSRGSAQEINQKKFPYFRQVLKTGLPVISEPFATNFGGFNRLAIYVAAPIKDNSGKISAVVVAKTPVEFVGNAILRTASLQRGTTYRLIDSSDQIFQNFNDPEKTSLGAKIGKKLPLFQEVNAQRQSQAWIGNTSAGEQMYAYAPLSNSGSLNWSIVTSTDTAIAFAPQRQLLQTIGLGTVLTAMVAAVLAALLAGRAIQPVLQATVAVEKLRQGKLDTRIQTQGNDELATLGFNINQMAERIQSLLEEQRQNTEQLVRQNAVLTNLARNDGLIEGNALAAARAFTEAIAKTLTVERVSVWLHTVSCDAIVCLDLYESKSQQHAEGIKLKAIDFPNYFKALDQDRPIVADDAPTDPATREFTSAYLTPLGITSRLDVPIRIAGRTMGVVCCEHVGVARQWKAQEQSFASSVANLLSLALESELLQTEVGHLLEVVSAVEDGDLATRAQVSQRTTGLVADTFNRLLEQLGQVLAQVLITAQQVSAGAATLEELAKTVATNATRQAQEVAQVLSLTEQVEHSAQNSAQKVNLTNRSLLDVRSVVEQGQTAIEDLTKGIEVLQQGTDRIVQRMKTLGEFVGLADQFVQEQSQIASLTQVLALNATLVAARASEQRDPRQFLVVAREFEAIATQVSTLAKQTNDGLESLQQRTAQIHTVVSAIDADVQSLGGLVSGFNKGVEQSSQVFGNVQTVTVEVVQAGQDVTVSSQEIVSAAQATAYAMRDIAALAEQTADLTYRSRLQSEDMDNLSSRLLDTIQFFRLPEGALAAEAAFSPPASPALFSE